MLTVNEIFHSIQGESTYAGTPCVFVRLTACDLRCSWCDTPYAFYEGRKVALDEVVTRVEGYKCPLVEITGGEPLLQEGVYPLMDRLLGAGLTVLLETGGHLDIGKVPPAVVKIVDVKCPGSGEADKQEWRNIDRLLPHDQVKFVIQDEVDYRYACDVVSRYGLGTRCAAVLFSPVHGVLDPKVLSAWVLRDHVPARVQLQLHKYIWGADVRGV
jgi:7-carboxy-7-deazaguanine synthase